MVRRESEQPLVRDIQIVERNPQSADIFQNLQHHPVTAAVDDGDHNNEVKIDDGNDIDFSALSQTKPLPELSVDDVINLLKSLKLSNFCQNFEENMIDGPTLMNCKSEDDVKELGIALIAKARRLYEEIVKFKSTGVPLTLLSEEHHREVPEMINCDDGGTDLSTMTNSIP